MQGGLGKKALNEDSKKRPRRTIYGEKTGRRSPDERGMAEKNMEVRRKR